MQRDTSHDMELNIEQILNLIFIAIALYTYLQHFFIHFGPIYRLKQGEREVNLAPRNN